MKVTEVKVQKVSTVKGTKATARVVLDGELSLGFLTVREGVNDVYLAYPSNEGANCYYPVSRGLREEIEKAVINEYKKGVPHG